MAVLKGFGPETVNFLFVVFYGGISVAQLAAGSLTDRYGRGAFMVAGLILAAFGLTVFLAVPSPWTLVPLGGASIGLGLFCVASLAQLNDGAPQELKATVSGGYYLAWGLGYVLGPLAIGSAETVFPGFGYYAISASLAVQAIAILRSQG